MAKFLTLTDKCSLRCSFCYEISPFGEPHEFEADPRSVAPELFSIFQYFGIQNFYILNLCVGMCIF